MEQEKKTLEDTLKEMIQKSKGSKLYNAFLAILFGLLIGAAYLFLFGRISIIAPIIAGMVLYVNLNTFNNK